MAVLRVMYEERPEQSEDRLFDQSKERPEQSEDRLFDQ
jgi:hypothetical protein